jgi:hypothetical protein
MTESPQDPYGGQPYYGQQPPPGYPPPGYYPPAGYPYGPPAYGYPQGYPPPYYPQPLQRPGTATTSSVLAFVNGGLLIAAALLLFVGASVVGDLQNSGQFDMTYTTTEFRIDAVVNLLAAGLLIAGGVLFAGRRTVGRTLIVAGGVIVIVAAIYWLVRFDAFATVVFYALLFSALAIIAIAMGYTAATKAWLSAAPPAQPTPYGG